MEVKMNNLHQKILDEEIVKPQLKKQVGWLGDFVTQSPYDKRLVEANNDSEFDEGLVNEEEDI